LSAATFVAHPTFELIPAGIGPDASSGPYTPAQIAQAYQFSSISFGSGVSLGKGETIAIVDAYDDPNIQFDLNTFDTAFGLPSTTVIRFNETGGASYPSRDSTGGWELEESLDVEWAHAMAPGATIMLVEASSAGGNDLLAAVNYAANHANVVSMSWGGGEFSGENAYDTEYFDKSGVVFVASSGDSGPPAEWPSVSPNVLGVGGTALALGTNNVWSSETGWSGSSGGPSIYEAQPSYQTGVVTQTSSSRAAPDVAYDASPSTGVDVYDSYPYERTTLGWVGVGGTSVGAPNWAALIAIADQGLTASSKPALDSTNPQQVMDILYQNPGVLHDITSGTSQGSTSYLAGAGYDYVTGMGSPIANLVVGALDGTSTTPPPPPAPPPPTSPDKLVVTTLSASQTAGNSFSITVTAENSNGALDPNYGGTIKFTSTDGQASLPGSFKFLPSNDGQAMFTVTLKTAGSESITATDTANSATTGTLSGLSVSAAAASQFVLSGLPSSVTAGQGQSVTVTAKDPYGNLATGYTGTVKFSSTDSAASLPGPSTFSITNKGVASFPVTFETPGTQSLSVKDMTSGFSATQSGIAVAPVAPSNLQATTASSSQINLSWTGSNGATSYIIQQSLNGSTSWTQAGTTTGGSNTTFQDTGLASGTTYYFRVIATAGSINSGYSNVANATTTGAPVATAADSIWSNSYVPSENASSAGSYEVGLKFTSSVAGNVTGIRFYKQPWMGINEIGHLWSSTGTLLATATFANETSHGWQQVNLATPVAVQANTVYIVSFSTGGGYFGITTSFFSSGGVTNGPLEALPNSVSGGNGVYNRAGQFPNVDGNGMNFWVDVAFSPSNSGNALLTLSGGRSVSTAAGAFVIGALGNDTGQSPQLHILARAATPAGPFGYVTGSGGSTSTILGTLAASGPVAQARELAPWLNRLSWVWG
jgi:subtilase family serine protease